MKTYIETHPWITFKLDLSKASSKFWLLLGEAQSKCIHISGIPMMPQTAKHLHQIYLAKGALATTAIEGNTLSEDEVIKQIEGKLKLPSSKEYLGQEIENIVNACNLIGKKVLIDRQTLVNLDDIKTFYRIVLDKLPLDDFVLPGEIRTYRVGVARYHAVEPQYCDLLLKQLTDWLNNDFNQVKGYTIAFGILKAIIAHLYFAWIHPFGDGNGRTARLLEFQLLLGVGVPSAAAHLLSNHYNQTRQEYFRQLEYSSKSGGDIFPFIEYALQGFVDGLKEQIDVIRNQQLEVHWRNYIYDIFKDKNKHADNRQRRLILDLSAVNEPVSVSKFRHISPRIAAEYANRTQKTIIRDINTLVKLNLIRKTEKGFVANKEVILAFLPLVVDTIEG
jgi:Fic family protein